MEIVFIRHGKASFGEDNYDELSTIGKKQSEKLSDYLIQKYRKSVLICTGSLIRHKQTMFPYLDKLSMVDEEDFENISFVETDDLNEFSPDLFEKIVSKLTVEDKPIQKIYKKYSEINEKNSILKHTYFFKLMERCILEWKNGFTPYGEESFFDFKERVVHFADYLNSLRGDKKSVLVFTSATPISILLSYFLKINEENELFWIPSLWNSSISTILKKGRVYYPGEINTIPHLFDKQLRTLI
ncbi:MAG: phosphoglycerate mutase family protein [Leptospiraceae bacterium]|nr:phosphoglycerate mutase family protein [Leptospiraceae bacterium]MCP5513005.1 phosphoglycerate mutase family protein [Leptospiraceae bacterium]